MALKRVGQSPCFHQNLMNGCYAQDGDHDWSDSCTSPLPAHPCRLEINSLSTTSKNEDIRGDHSSSSSFNPNTIRFLLSPRRREQEPDCVWVERGLKRTESFSEAIILSPFFKVCRLYHLQYSCTVALCP